MGKPGEGFGEGIVLCSPLFEVWRMTGSAEKCFSMNGVERCVPRRQQYVYIEEGSGEEMVKNRAG